MVRMWSTRLMAGAIVAVLILVGAGFLVSAAYMALAEAFSPAIAALTLGLALIVVALLVMLITAWVAASINASLPERAVAERASVTQAEAASFAAGIVAPEIGGQLGVVMRNLNPVTIAAVVAGVIAGLLKERVGRRG